MLIADKFSPASLMYQHNLLDFALWSFVVVFSFLYNDHYEESRDNEQVIAIMMMMMHHSILCCLLRNDNKIRKETNQENGRER